MTRIANWSAALIGRIWLVGLGLQGAILLADWASSTNARAEWRAADARIDSIQKAMARAAPLPPRVQDSLRRTLVSRLDSLGVTLAKHGGTTDVKLSPASDSSWNSVLSSLSRSVDELILRVTLELFLIPTLLIVLTVTWAIARRRAVRTLSTGVAA